MRYREFTIEALKPSEYRPLVKGWDKSRYSDLFGGEYRIYIPLETPEPVSKTVKVNPQVKQEVEKLGYTIDDYLKGIAVKTENGRVRQIKIGKLLSPETAKIFANDPVRGAARQSNQIVVISRHPYDIAGMSTDRGWTSCMNLREPHKNKRFVPLDIRAGTIIAYLITDRDTNIRNAKARVLIKPFVNIMNKKEIALGIEDRVVKYGTAPPEFIKTVSTWVDKINASRKLIGIFELNPKLYPDGDTRKFVGKSKTALLNSMDESNQIVLLQKDSSLFRYIKNPSERVQIAAVSKYGSAIKYIIRAGITPSEAVQIAAVSKYGSAINYIIRAGITPSEAVQTASVSEDAYAICDIIRAGITPSEAVQTASVSEDAYAIKYIIDAGITPSETVQLAAVSRSGLVIHYIIDAGITPSEAVQIAAVRHPHAMKIIIGAGITPSAAVRWAR